MNQSPSRSQSFLCHAASASKSLQSWLGVGEFLETTEHVLLRWVIWHF